MFALPANVHYDLANVGADMLGAVAFFAAAMFTQTFDEVMLPPNTLVLGTPNREGGQTLRPLRANPIARNPLPSPNSEMDETNSLGDAAKPHASNFGSMLLLIAHSLALGAKIARTLQGLIMQRIVSVATLIGVGLSEIAAAAVLVAPATAFTNNWNGVYIGAHLDGAWQSASDWT